MGYDIPDMFDLVPADNFLIHHVAKKFDRPGQDLLMNVLLNDLIKYLIVD
jgi:hypothetical protein